MNKGSVIQLIDSLDAGGAEMMAVNITNLLDENAFDSHICVTRNEGVLREKLNKNVGYLYVNRKKVLDFRALLAFKKYLKKNSITIVHVHSTSIYFAVLAKLIYWKLKIIWHDHYGFSLDYSKRPIRRLKLASVFINSIISVNKGLESWALNELYCKKVHYLSNFAALKETVKQTTLKGEENKRITIVAGLRPQKDHFTLIEAFHQIVTEHRDWSLHIIGKDYKNEYSSSVKKLIKSKNLVSHIFLYGARNDVQHILSQSSIAVLSSKSEGLPVSLLEYGLCNVASVCTDVGQCSDVLKDEKLLVPKENSSLLAKSLQLLIEDTEYRKLSAEKLHKNVIDNFGSENYIEKLKIIYQDAKGFR